MSTETNISGGYGLCPACGKQKTSINWCPPCHADLLLKEHSGWTSGDKNLDDFIKKTITDARRSYDYLEWIPFENFKVIKQIGRGGFATAFLANRTNCRTGHFEWDEKAKKYFRGKYKDYRVALKSFHNTPDIASTFLNEIKTHHKCMMLQEDEFLQCYGISRNPVTKEFITVLDYAQQGDLRHFLQKNHETLKWEDRLRIVTKIAKDLKVIHSTGLIHGDFHSGNVLQESTIPKVSDFGLSRVDKDHIPEGGVFGVVPYIAPEVLRGNSYRKPADVYSYGTIMWEISSGRPAFYDIAHDYRLIAQICNGTRPQIITGTPKCYAELMQRCWDGEPAKRPTAEEIYDTCLKWYNYAKEQKSDIYQQFAKADAIAITRDRAILKNNPEAIYTSRLIHYVTKKQDSCNDTRQQDLYINTSLQNLCNDTRQQDLYLNDMTE
ncbi:11160_t:CDS:2 [Funneliformis geosporum]|uniref:16078_t:CDS:1 n=1 Tax=Funneliformis geosporum TaxID=1117311 RepID=A0A9W4SDA9_9GLOM|nr:16078_t:CDS:2 [Funneliformis geosporum]CAI2166998.1 11160_t:CDS:2 [Funneliformis geosporum]